jgi:hypothetical protein
VGKECSEEREPQECTCSPRSLQNAVAVAVTTGAATVCSHSPSCRCGAGCRDRRRQSKNSVQIRQQEQKKKTRVSRPLVTQADRGAVVGVLDRQPTTGSTRSR